MILPGFTAESSLDASTRVYVRRNRSVNSLGMTPRLVSPAAQRQQWCEKKYRGGVTHYFPVTVCESIFPDFVGSVATMAAVGPRNRLTAFDPHAAAPPMLSERFGRFKRCRVVALPFYGEVTTTTHCDDSIPDSSELKVRDHPELTTHWTGGLTEIPPPYNPGWFGFVGEDCGCCGGLLECPDGRCIPPFKSCTVNPT